MYVVLFFFAHWFASLFCQSFFMHRYASHQMFTMSKGWEKFFYILSFIFQGSSYLSPRAYAVLHRMHHAYADTEKDPHSPKYDKNFFAMMMRTKNVYNEIYHRKVPVEDRFTKNLPAWDAFDRFADNWAFRIAWGLFYATVYYLLDAQIWMYFTLLPIQWVMGPFHGVIINWFAHLYGKINFKVGDTSKNLFPVDFLMLGEGYHNNHHKRPMNPNFGYKWYEFDPIYPFVVVFKTLGIIKIPAKPAAAGS
ncbi:MAG: acyl-CoA desaturase [Vicingaceae bacterium]